MYLNSKVCFVDHLTVLSWIRSIFPYLSQSRLLDKTKVLQCYVIDGSLVSLSLAKITASILGIQVSKLEFRLCNVRDDVGALINLQIFYRDMADFRQYLHTESSMHEISKSGFFKNLMRLYLTKAAVGGGPGDRGTIGHAMFIIRVCAWHMKQQNWSAHTPVLFLESISWFGWLRRYAVSHGVTVNPVQPPLRLGKSLRAKLPTKLETLLILARHRRFKTIRHNLCNWRTIRVANTLLRKCSGWETTNHPADNQSNPMVVIQGGTSPNLDNPELQSEFFFWQMSPIKGSSVLVTYTVPSAPLTEQNLADFQTHEMTPIVLHPSATTVSSAPFFFPKKSAKQPIHIPVQLRESSMEVKWMSENLSRYYQLKDYWKKVCSQFNAKVFVTQDKYDASHCAISDGLRESGGIATVYQRAFESHPAVETAIGADIVFGFSTNVANVEQLSGSEISYHVATGFPAGHRPPLLKNDAISVRQTLLKNGANTILAFFDESSMPDDRWHTGHQYMQENYYFLLQKMLDNPWIGLVIKPKVPRTLRARLGAVASMLDQAEATGRCFVYHDNSFRGISTPVAAALSADIAIHSHLVATTAGLEAALAGVPCLVLDREGWYDSPLYNLNDAQVVFRTWAELWESCQNHWSRPGHVRGFGDWSSVLNEMDSFRDGKAGERMGTYIHWLLKGFQQGHDRETIMAEAAQRYCDQWGNDKITYVKKMDCN